MRLGSRATRATASPAGSASRLLVAALPQGAGEVEAVSGQPERAGVESQLGLGELVVPDPPQLFGLVVAARHGMAWCTNKEAHVEVKMIWLGAPAVDKQVHVNVHRLAPDLEAVDAGLLGGFTQGNAWEGTLTIGVTAWLQPATDLAVQQHQPLRCVVVHHPCRCRQVSGLARAMERIGMTGGEADQPSPVLSLDAISRLESLHGIECQGEAGFRI